MLKEKSVDIIRANEIELLNYNWQNAILNKTACNYIVASNEW